jgi:hypothetical protein
MKENKTLKARKGMKLNVGGEWRLVTDLSWDGVECEDANGSPVVVSREQMKTATLWNWNAA